MELQSLYKAQQIRKKNADNTYPLQHVISTVSDRAIPELHSPTGKINFYQADIKSYSDYYPFGMQMPGRFETAAGHNYRFGFQGSEKDNEVSGDGNSYTTEYRQYDPRLGRWTSTDPKATHPKLISWSPYHYGFDNPIYFVDTEGDIPWSSLLVGYTFGPRTGGNAFGMRNHPIKKVDRLHAGIDLAAPEGTEIQSAARGKVVFAGNRNDGYGNQIVIDHGNGYFTRYAHIKDGGIKVSENDDVRNGQVIALVGSTGGSTGPHLHFEIRKTGMWGEAIDPTSIEDLDVFLHGNKSAKYADVATERLSGKATWLSYRISQIEKRYKKGKLSEKTYNARKDFLQKKLDNINEELEARKKMEQESVSDENKEEAKNSKDEE